MPLALELVHNETINREYQTSLIAILIVILLLLLYRPTIYNNITIIIQIKEFIKTLLTHFLDDNSFLLLH